MAGTFSFQFTLLQLRRVVSTQVISIYKDYSGPRANFVMTEDQDLLAKIGLLAGQINQHKNQATPPTQPSRGGRYTSYHSTHPRRHAGWAPYRGRASHPSSRRHAAPHRNRTLVLSNLSTPAESASGTPSCNASTDEMNEAKPVCQNGWVAKRDRHMQLINSAIYDKEAQARTKAIEESRKLKAQRIAQREEAKVLRYVQGVGGYRPVATPVVGQRAASYRITIQDVPFQVVRGGSKLIRLPNEPSAANVTPKKVNIGGVNFVRSKKGNLHRLGSVVSRKKTGTVKKKNERCKRFTSTGSCFKGPNCPYIHDPNKVAICKEFLQTGKCAAGSACDLSHEPSAERSPSCLHFLRGRCSNPSCRYAHVRVNPGAPVCHDFAILGYCSKGEICDQRHVHECPDYANTGNCGNRKCQLPHVDRAGQIRKIAANKAETTDDRDSADDDDILSDEEAFDEIDSDDVDSDDSDDDPIIITEGVDTGEISQQQDFVRFSS
ncbi:CCCH zinc finger protein [Histoplasma capsulatum G186AR]|uniref:CCCH zinc finger protein n=2 Tax=Ajellomyces capsulatus TaxID=5037 RepID=C0NG98_AJECG|nr:CCCH zinc finger protein [Histoplasma capsulatum G186AR]EEH10269.1 CCCH zinc finger protein [Histoplasma capsulatum G186AR]